MDDQFILVTKSYRDDLPAFERLCATVDRHMPEIEHHILIDTVDLPVFARFATSRRIIVDCGKLLPQLHTFELLGKRLWWRMPFRIVRGWIYQQLAKIAFVSQRSERAVVLVDSDTEFVRPLRPDHVFDGDKVRLFRNPGVLSGGEKNSDDWHNFALKVFGLPQTGYTGADYISQAVIWSPSVINAMIQRIEAVNGEAWLDALLRPMRFSEYVLYGVFSEQVAGPHQALLSPGDREICHCSWHYDLEDEQGLESFAAGIEDHHVAVLLQSNLGLSEADRLRVMSRFGL